MDLKVVIGSWEAPPEIGGPASYIGELVTRLSDHVEVTLLVPAYASSLEKKGLIIQKISSVDVPIIRVCLFSIKASNHIKRLNTDLVHDNGVLGFSNFSPFIETWHHGNRISRAHHSPKSYIYNYRESLTLRGLYKANSIIAISSVAKNELIQNYGIGAEKINVIPHGVDIDFFKPLSLGSIDHSNRGKIKLLHVGNISPRKNLSSLIESLHILKKQQHDIHLTIAGGGDATGINNLVHNLRLTENVTILGPVSRNRLLELYNNTDFTVISSFKEGFGLTMLESLACEKPVITTPVGISDVIKQYTLGVVSKDFSASSIASSINTAITQDFQNLRSFIVANFCWDKTIQKTLEIYKKTVECY